MIDKGIPQSKPIFTKKQETSLMMEAWCKKWIRRIVYPTNKYMSTYLQMYKVILHLLALTKKLIILLLGLLSRMVVLATKKWQKNQISSRLSLMLGWNAYILNFRNGVMPSKKIRCLSVQESQLDLKTSIQIISSNTKMTGSMHIVKRIRL